MGKEAQRDGADDGHPRMFWWFVGAAALTSILFYRDFVFHPERLIFGSDMLFEGISLRQFYVEEIRAGRGVPLWVPHIYAGMPFVALLPGPIFYPTTLLYFVMPLFRAIGWTFVIHTFLSGIFAYFMARSFRLRRASAVVCGTSFMLTGYVTSHLYGGHDGRMFAMILIPLALGLLNRALESGEARWFAGLALIVAIQVFTPHTQVMYFSSLALSLFLVFHLLFRVPRPSAVSDDPERAGRPGWARYARPVLGFAAAFLAAIAIAGPQLFPTLALLDDATRAAAERGYEFAASYALPPQELTALFLPDLIGSLGTYWGQNPLKLHTEYLGSVPLALALLGLGAGFGRGLPAEHKRVIGFLGGASLLGILFALGAATPLHRIAYAILPLIDSLRAPAMMLGPVTAFIALLAGYGWEAVLTRRNARDPESVTVSWLPLAVLGGPVLILGAAALLNPGGLANFVRLAWYPAGWPLEPHPLLIESLRSNGLVLLIGFSLAWGVAYVVSRRKLREMALLAVLFFAVLDLARVDARYLTVRDAAPELQPDAVLAALARDVAPGQRVWAPQLPAPVRNYRPNQMAYHGVSSATGLQKFLLSPYARLVGGIRPDEGLIRDPPLTGLLNVRYLVTPGAQQGLQPLAEADGRYLYEVPESVPYAFFPAAVASVADTTEAIARTRANPDPVALSIVEAQPGRELPTAGRGSAEIRRYEPDLIELDVDAVEGGLLTLSEIHHPGWRAYVDDVETFVWRTNTAFRGVVVPAGTHRVRFEYRSAAYRLGLWTSLLTLLALLGLAGVSWRRARSRGGSDD